MKLGKPRRVYRIEPVRDPVPQRLPDKTEPAPRRAPAEPSRRS